MTYAEHGFEQTLSAARMARATAWAHRRLGNESEARRSFQRAYWWLTRTRMWKDMVMTTRTIKCPICGRPYKFHDMTAADQSACPDCVREADRRERNPTREEQDYYARGRQRFFGSWSRT